MAAAEFPHAQRQITVRLQALVEDLHVTRAVHRLDAVFAVFRRGGEHGVFVVFPVAGFFPQHAVHHERTFHFLVLILFELHAHEGFQLAEDSPTVVVPEHHTRRFFLHVIQVELFADLAVIALGRFFQTLQVGVQLLLVCPGGTVDTLQHFVFAVAAPVSAGGFLQFEMVAETHVRHVRAAAHVDVFFVVIQARTIVMADVLIQDRHFIDFAALSEGVTGFLPADLLLDDVVILIGQLVHPLFQQIQVFLRQGAVDVHVIIKTVVDHRTDRHFGIRPQLLDRMTQQVRAGVAHDFQTVFIFDGDDGQLRI